MFFRIHFHGKWMHWLACLAFWVVVPAAATQKPSSDDPGTQVFAKVSPSVVVVLGRDMQGQPVAQGSGVVIAPERVITNCHVLEEALSLEVRSGEHNLAAARSRSDPARDLCLLHVPGLTAPAVTRGSVRELRVGQRVYAVGAPAGLELTISEGIVSSLRRLESDVLIQTTAPISRGSSGGGLFNADGQLVGITAFQFGQGQSLNFALPADWIADLLSPSSEGKALLAEELTKLLFLRWLIAAGELAQKEDWQGLLRHAQAHVQQHPDDELAWFFVGLAYHHLGQHTQAIEAFKRAIAIKPDHAEAWNNLGLVYCAVGNRGAAIEVYKTLRKLNPEKASQLFNIPGCIVP
ncbi:MAG: trypsin-like peptidase domain-containing protein [Firmicutes bacterium]|nr:trypsin-like peptidase domain-containing protein [Bacillota bacterium]